MRANNLDEQPCTSPLSYSYAMRNFADDDLPEAVYGLRVSFELLPALGVQPALGRYFSPEEEQPGRGHMIILSDDLWRRRFAADPQVIGRRSALAASGWRGRC